MERLKSIVTKDHEKVEIDIDKLKTQVNNYKIEEPKLISQRDIEELDDQIGQPKYQKRYKLNL